MKKYPWAPQATVAMRALGLLAGLTACSGEAPAPAQQVPGDDGDRGLSDSGVEPTSDAGTDDVALARRCDPQKAFGQAKLVKELAGSASPFLTADELTVYFDRGWSAADANLYVASRPDRNSPFSEGKPIDELNTTANERRPTLTANGLTLYFWRFDTGGSVDAKGNIYKATRAKTTETFSKPVRVFTSTESDGYETPFVTSAGNTVLMAHARSREGGGTDWSLQWSIDGAVPRDIPGVTTKRDERVRDPVLSSDGLTLFYGSDPGIGERQVVKMMRRTSLDASFMAQTVLDTDISPTMNAGPSWLSTDGCVLYGSDISYKGWVALRPQ